MANWLIRQIDLGKSAYGEMAKGRIPDVNGSRNIAIYESIMPIIF